MILSTSFSLMSIQVLRRLYWCFQDFFLEFWELSGRCHQRRWRMCDSFFCLFGISWIMYVFLLYIHVSLQLVIEAVKKTSTNRPVDCNYVCIQFWSLKNNVVFYLVHVARNYFKLKANPLSKCIDPGPTICKFIWCVLSCLGLVLYRNSMIRNICFLFYHSNIIIIKY